MVGPFISMGPLLEQLEATPADVWALTDSYQFGYHLQSYFLGFTNGALAERPLQRFWAGIRHAPDKAAIIGRYELGLSRLVREEGFVHVPAFAHELVVAPGSNPVITGWRELLGRGFPFVKREILRDPSVAPGGSAVRAVVKRLLAVDVDDWAEDGIA
jgi:lipopolysaccharide biosynthesis protein